MPVALKGSSSGDVTLTAPAVAGTTTITFPASTGNAVVDVATQTLTNKTLTSPVINNPTFGASLITAMTQQTASSSSSLDFTSIPSTVRRITVVFNNISMTDKDSLLIRLGTGGVFATTGYSVNSGSVTDVPAAVYGTSTSGFLFPLGKNSANANTISGHLVLMPLSGNNWIGVGASRGILIYTGVSGNVTLGGTLDSIRLIPNGTDLIDAGSVNVFYE